VEGLTARQLEALVLIADSIRDRGYAPSQRELLVGMGVSASSGKYAAQLIDVLEDRGYLERAPTLSRALRVTDKGWGAVDASQHAAQGFRFYWRKRCPCRAVYFGKGCPICLPVIPSPHAGPPGSPDP
jgi:SOS-response transcriptional repressor LexA